MPFNGAHRARIAVRKGSTQKSLRHPRPVEHTAELLGKSTQGESSPENPKFHREI